MGKLYSQRMKFRHFIRYDYTYPVASDVHINSGASFILLLAYCNKFHVTAHRTAKNIEGCSYLIKILG
jgi:hypothetical protein